jgi:hypothetical protein
LRQQANTASVIAGKPEPLTKLHGNAKRLTSHGERKLKALMTRLCSLGTPGPQLVRICNREIGLGWTLQGYFRRANEWDIQWHPMPRSGIQHPLTEFLTDDQRRACWEDPRYEARQGITERVICRECFAKLKDGAMQGKRHLWTIHEQMTLKQYRLRNPEAPIFTLERIAGQLKIDLHEYITAVANEHVTPEVLTVARANLRYEDYKGDGGHGKGEYVICRVSRCGFKARSGLTKHLRNAHSLSKQDYWPTPPLHPLQLRKRMSAKNSERLVRLKKRAQRRRTEDADAVIVDKHFRDDMTWPEISERMVSVHNKYKSPDGWRNLRNRWLKRGSPRGLR